MPTSYYRADHAWIGGTDARMASRVLIGVADGVITSVEPDAPPPEGGSVHLAGIVLPGFVNAHSHAFHRALRGRSESGLGDFWTWREMMYEVAGRLDPDLYVLLATAVYQEMLLAGFTSVAEFHYLHHSDGGEPYSDPNAMGRALLEAARRARIRLTLLDACYLSGGTGGKELEGVQKRFGDGDGERWAGRVEDLLSTVRGDSALASRARVGVAVHSVRAVPPEAMRTVAAFSAHHDCVLHFHLSEQRRENEECLAIHGVTPTTLLRQAEVLSSHATAVHATHLDPRDITQLGYAGTRVCACPTTERDLADGVGPFGDLVDAGSSLCIGTDSHAVIDPFEEMRAIELNERLATNTRGTHTSAALLRSGTSDGAKAIGWPEAGAITPGAIADFVAVSVRNPRMAGTFERETDDGAAAVVFAATAADVHTVVVGGEVVVEDGRHRFSPDVAGELTRSISAFRQRD
ncbi:MAG TPA: formimidoylglutamate deiminase [Acidimicrobiales bacterium]|nr:formimidoylglutamate deiminase [Acidimicrobiales bacterium]